MKLYIISLAVGVLAGLLYGVLNVRSPAPPVAALIGLFGMLIGEQLVPVAKQYFSPDSVESTEKINAENTVIKSTAIKSADNSAQKHI